MSLWKLISPWRLMFGLILALALALRLWGLEWGPADGSARQAAEWATRVVDGLSFREPVHSDCLHQVLYSITALSRALVELLLGWFQLLLGQVRFFSEISISTLLAGRMVSALLGAAQALLAGIMARRIFESPAAGLVAGLLVAVHPLGVTESHLFSTTTTLGLFALLTAWGCWSLAERPRGWAVFRAGLLAGLAAGASPGGIFVWPLAALAYWLGIHGLPPKPWRGYMLWPGLMVLGLLTGLALGAPHLWLYPDDLGRLFLEAWTVPAGDGSPLRAGARAWRMLEIWFKVGGAEVVALWLVAAGVLYRRGQWNRLALGLPLPLFMAATVFWPIYSVESWLAVWLPLASVLAVWPLVVLCRTLDSYPRQVAAVSLLGLALALLPLWRSLGIGYLFWQEDTLTTARKWLSANLRPGDEVLAAGSVPGGVYPGMTPVLNRPDAGKVLEEGEYLLLADSRTGGELAGELAGELERVARLDLTGGWGPPPLRGGERFPAYLSPPVEIYAPLSPRAVTQPLSVSRAPADWERPYGLVYDQASAYGRDQGVVLLPTGGLGHRVFRSSGLPGPLGLYLRNLGDDLALVRVSMGLWSQAELSLYPGQEEALTLPGLNWPPVAEGITPVRVELDRGGRVLAMLGDNPLILGRRALERGDLEEAVPWLEAARGREADRSQGFEASALLAGALAGLGRMEEAAAILGDMGDMDDEPVAGYMSLALAGEDPDWDQRFQAFSGYHPRLLRRALSVEYELEDRACFVKGRRQTLDGPGYQGVYTEGDKGRDNRLELTLAAPLPRGPLEASLVVSWSGRVKGNPRLATIRVSGRGPLGEETLGKRDITPLDLPSGRGRIGVPFQNPRDGLTLSVILGIPKGADFRLERFGVGADLVGHMQSVLCWYHDAWGRVHLSEGRYREAVVSFESLLKLSPGFTRAYLPLARALVDVGHNEKALEQVRKSEEVFSSMPDRLAEVRELYTALQHPDDAQRVDMRLAHLRPSLSRESRFEGGLTLLGYDLPKNHVRPGERMDLGLYWRAWERPTVNYYVFLHLRGPAGRTLNFDHLLDQGRVNMTSLKPGQVVREDLPLIIPDDAPPGTYKLITGVWDATFTRRGLPVMDGQGKGGQDVALGVVEIR